MATHYTNALEEEVDKYGFTKKSLMEGLINCMKDCSMVSKNDPIVEIKPAKFGNGLYALKDFNIGEIITKYPVEFLLDKETGQTYYDKNIFKELNEKEVMEELEKRREYALTVFDNYIIYATGDFTKNHDYLGHMPNDRGFKPNKIYRKNLNNCSFNQNLTICTRPIKRGEQIFCTYGNSYWFAKNKTGLSKHDIYKMNLKNKN